jgi:hypothetical protein
MKRLLVIAIALIATVGSGTAAGATSPGGGQGSGSAPTGGHKQHSGKGHKPSPKKHKGRHKRSKRHAKKRKRNVPSHLWYRVAVEGHGRYHAEQPDDPTGAATQEITTGFKLKSRTAVIINRDVSAADPRHPVIGNQFNTSAGLSGDVTVFSRTWTREATQYCTRETASDSPVAYATLDGNVSILTGPDYQYVTFGADFGLDHGTVRHEESGRECHDSNGSLYYKRDPKSSEEPGAWGGTLCEKNPNYDDPDTVQTISGEVHWGSAFQFTVNCNRTRSSGSSVELASLDYTVSFSPCPGGGRKVKAC